MLNFGWLPSKPKQHLKVLNVMLILDFILLDFPALSPLQISNSFPAHFITLFPVSGVCKRCWCLGQTKGKDVGRSAVITQCSLQFTRVGQFSNRITCH